MKEASKPPQSSAIASDLRAVFSLLRTRRTKVFLYAFAFGFVAFSAYLAFFPAEKASPWFTNLFNSASVSTAPYRSQISSVFSYIFPNSSYSPSPGNAAPLPANLPVDGGGVQKGGGLVGNLTRAGGGPPTGGVSGKNKAESVVGSPGNGIVEKNETADGAGVKKGGGLAAKNQTVSGIESRGSSAAAKNVTTSGTGSKGGEDWKKNSTTKGGNGGSINDLGKDEVSSTKAMGSAAKNQTGSGVQSKNETTSGVAPAKSSDSSMKNQTKVGDGSKKDAVSVAKNMTVAGAPSKNQTAIGVGSAKSGDLTMKNQTGKANGTQVSTKESTSKPQKDGAAAAKNQSSSGVPSVTKGTTSPAKTDKKGASSLSTSLSKGNGSSVEASGVDGKKQVDWISAMKGCDIFQGKWVKDDSYPLYPEGSCPHIDEPFDCYLNGRPDLPYQKLRWQPNGCNIPRLNATDMLERLRGKRLVFVGDSLNRNMWESLVCVLRNSIKDKKKVFEASGRHEFRTEGSYSFVFKDFDCSVEFFRSPFLVQEWEAPVSNGKSKETLRLDIIERSSSKYKDADVIIFNTGHWWTHEKTSKGKDYYQEGNHIYSELNVVEAFHKALDTWAKWVDANVNPKKSLVFFRGYSASHFSGGQWNSGGQCDKETEPIKNEKYLRPYPPKMTVLESVLKGMKTPVSFLNITRMTDYRKDAHPSIYRKQNLTDEERRAPERYQDCSHWCLPGVPDSWNELLYAQLIIKQQQTAAKKT
ncbi:protein trichome birefringence-like [Canna indica]|uniref:Protein trichome birefringence-like n=1 Tax=Canna indica TaxID=4628 RepID=A0AAQ3L4F3_9LILI|nr:protein trichome birefringence-like [Canna indica]